MRTIKFRGKRIDNKQWVYGHLYKLPLPSGEACMILTQDNNHLDNSLEPKYHLAFTLWVDLFIVDPATVGQFTGLTDINGREIYEGDIVEYYSTDTYCINPDCEPHVRGYGLRLYKRIKTVMFDEGIFYADNTFVIVPLAHEGIQVEDIDELKNDQYFDANGYDLDDAVGMEVVGNVFDNPELLEEKS